MDRGSIPRTGSMDKQLPREAGRGRNSAFRNWWSLKWDMPLWCQRFSIADSWDKHPKDLISRSRFESLWGYFWNCGRLVMHPALNRDYVWVRFPPIPLMILGTRRKLVMVIYHKSRISVSYVWYETEVSSTVLRAVLIKRYTGFDSPASDLYNLLQWCIY